MTNTHPDTLSILPCRINDAQAPDLLVSVFGPVETPLRQGVYDPATDTVTRDAGDRLANYYKESLGFPHFRPLDRTLFRQAPTGWLTWMYYGRDVTPDEVLVNARWIAENLKDYGVEVILLDDGWQADGRNWEGLRESFPQGMGWLAGEIRQLGLTPGLWLCPHGQDNTAFVEATGGFIACNTFGGPYTVDPTDPNGLAYIQALMGRLTREWGYGYLKFDGISDKPGYGVLHGYRTHQQLFADQSIAADDAYRRFFGAIKDSVSSDVFINACSVKVCPEVIGLCDGMRMGSDTDCDWNGFLRAVSATMHGYFLHTVAVYADPDCCLLRSPLSLDMARAWATLYGVTGQLLMFDDRMPDLGQSRLDILKKIAPSADIRPFDLFPADRMKSIFDLKVHHRGRAYDVVAAFNYDENVQRLTQLDFGALGLDPAARYHVYDFWHEDYLGVYEAGLCLEIAPAACRVITLYPEGDFPVLLSTSRHILQGWPDVEAFSASPEAGTLCGTSAVIEDEPYTLTFGLPNDGTSTYLLESATVDGQPVAIRQGRGVAHVSWTPTGGGAVAWTATFTPAPLPRPTSISSFPYMLGARDLDPWTVELFWVSFGSPAAYFVKHNGVLVAHTFGTRFRMRGLEYGSRHDFEVGVADLDGRKSQRTGTIAVTVGETLPPELCLSDLEWQSASSGYLPVKKDKANGGPSLSTGGRRYAKGLGTHPASLITYELHGLFTTLTGACGIEDQNGMPATTPHEQSGQAIFSITGDGRELLAPTRMTHGQMAQAFALDITGVQRLELLVEPPADAIPNHAPHANWLEMKVRT
jgi:hypothetical protein